MTPGTGMQASHMGSSNSGPASMLQQGEAIQQQAPGTDLPQEQPAQASTPAATPTRAAMGGRAGGLPELELQVGSALLQQSLHVDPPQGDVCWSCG